MKKTLSILLALLALTTACKDDEETYPSLITEFADFSTSKDGKEQTLLLDDGRNYVVSNQISGVESGRVYRVVCGYVPENNGKAVLYTLNGAYILRDSTALHQSDPTKPADIPSDPTNILSAWRAGRYINLHLSPRTQGADHFWGFVLDSLTEKNAHISLHHRQGNDPTSYSTTVYASLPVDSLKDIEAGDTITLNVLTFKGTQTWKMKK